MATQYARLRVVKRRQTAKWSVPSLTLALKNLSTRYRLLAYGAGCILLTLMASAHIQGVYTTTLRQFEGIVADNSVKVDAAIQAVQQIASVNKYAADYIGGLTPATQEAARKKLYQEFQGFRNQMFTIRNGIISADEVSKYQEAEQAIYHEYWAQISLLINAQSSKNKAAAIESFAIADAIFENKIAPAMRTLEQQNYETMRRASTNAMNRIFSDSVAVTFSLSFLAIMITALSFWIRFKVRRYLTPGLDLAMVLAWVLVFVIFSQLSALPEQLRVMVQDAYYSISASARLITDANRANVTESAAINDPANAVLWQSKFDRNVQLITLRLCGQANCTKESFSTGGLDRGNTTVIANARKITPLDSSQIDKNIPLMGNITFAGEVAALERARTAFLDYLLIDVQTRGLIADGKLSEAITLNTGKSDEAFFRFVDAMNNEKAINRAVFDRTWESVKTSLPMNQLLYGVGACLLVIALCAGGVYHRFKEL